MAHKSLIASALAIAALGSLGLAGPASAAKTKTTVSIQTEANGFSGFVKSSKSSCHSGRKVTLYRKSGKAWKKAGSDTAQPNQDGSQWSIDASKKGKYYASVKATGKCKAAKSKTLSRASASAAAKTKTTISIQAGSSFSGFVKSSKTSCHSGRKVTLYRKSGKKSVKVGSDIAQPNQDGSQWSINTSKKGKYYAKVSATKSCKAAKSRTVSGPQS